MQSEKTNTYEDKDDLLIKRLERNLGVDWEGKYSQNFEKELEEDGLFDLLKDEGNFSKFENDGEEKLMITKENKKAFQNKEKPFDLLKRYYESNEKEALVSLLKNKISISEHEELIKHFKISLTEYFSTEHVLTSHLVLLMTFRLLLTEKDEDIYKYIFSLIKFNFITEKIAEKISFLFLFDLLGTKSFTDLIKAKIIEGNYAQATSALQLCGRRLRKRNPSCISELSDIAGSINEVKDDSSLNILQKLVSYIKANRIVTCEKPPACLKLIKTLKELKRISKNNITLPDIRYEEIMSSNFDKIIFQLVTEELPDKSLENKNFILEKFSSTLQRLNCSSTNEKLIVAYILEHSDYMAAANAIHKLKIYFHNLDEIPKSIFKLFLLEKTYNSFYVHLSAQICRLNSEVIYQFYLKIWTHYAKLSSAKFTKGSKRLALFSADMINMNIFSFKFLKNLDFETIYRSQRLFNVFLMKDILERIPQDQLNTQIKKYLISDNDSLKAFEIKEFSKYFSEKIIPKLLSNKNSSAREKLINNLEILLSIN